MHLHKFSHKITSVIFHINLPNFICIKLGISLVPSKLKHSTCRKKVITIFGDSFTTAIAHLGRGRSQRGRRLLPLRTIMVLFIFLIKYSIYLRLRDSHERSASRTSGLRTHKKASPRSSREMSLTFHLD